jgi:peptidoglycan/LPS O-acetylase OafA/YrhL
VSGVDALRGLAALAVFACHIVAYWHLYDLPLKLVPLSMVGAHGVDVFVVLSGFCLAIPLAARGRQLNVRQFFGRRAWRILPAYWVALAIASVLAILPLTWPYVVAQQASAWDVIVHVLGLQTLFTPTLGTINGSLWSVSLEISLYALFPLTFWLWRRFGAGVLVVLASLVCVGWWLLGQWMQLGPPLEGFLGDSHSLPARWVQFAAGVLVAEAWVRRPRLRIRRVAFGAAISMLVATAATTWEAPEPLTLISWAVAGAMLVYLFSCFDRSGLLSQADAWGRRSFSFYLVHQPVLLLLAPVSLWLPGGQVLQLLLGGPLALVITSAAAEVLYRTVELPSHQRGRAAFPHPVRRLPTVARAREVKN